MAAPKPNLPMKQPEQKELTPHSPQRKVEKRTLIGPTCPINCNQKGSGLLIGQALPVKISPLEVLGMGFSCEKGEWVVTLKKGMLENSDNFNKILTAGVGCESKLTGQEG